VRLAAILGLVLASTSPTTFAASAAPVQWSVIEQDEVKRINSDLVAGRPTADIAIYFPSNLDAKFAEVFNLEDMLKQVMRAKEIFGAVGVQLNLLWVKTGRVDPAFLSIPANDLGETVPPGKYVNLYVEGRRQQAGITAKAQAAFDSIIEPEPSNDRTVYLVVLEEVYMSFHEKIDERTWEQRTITTGGLSFPSYSYTNIPRRLRGVITVNKTDPLFRVVAHELGHKLMNVSHEYKTVDPQHEVRADGGLMLYGNGDDIPSGREGRWHKERLLLSPYIYRQNARGERTWNADYRENGHYYDPIYGDKVVEFGPTVSPSAAN
jgi:hypothetical protein